MTIEAKLWPLEGEQGFKKIWRDVVFDRTRPIFEPDLDITKTNILVNFHEDLNKTMASRGTLSNHWTRNSQ